MCPKLAPQARDRQATGTGLFDGDRFDMIATGVLLDHLKLLYQPLNRYTSLLTETEIFVDTRKAAPGCRAQDEQLAADGCVAPARGAPSSGAQETRIRIGHGALS